MTHGLSSKEQPKPEGTGPAISELVMKDIEERMKVGEKTYGEKLRAHNGRDPLVDLYQELLDAAVYIRQELYERYNE